MTSKTTRIVKGFWQSPEGLEILEQITSKGLTIKDAAELAEVSRGAIRNALHHQRRSKSSTTPIRLDGALERAMATLSRHVEDFLVVALREANAELMSSLEDKNGEIARLASENSVLRADLASLREAAKSIERSRAKDILSRAGIVHGD